MNRLLTRTFAAAAGLVLAAGVAGCGDEPATAPAPVAAPSAPAASSAPPASPTPERLEAIYLDATATHLCSVQSRVYTDPAAMAAAFESKPVYTTLTDLQVEQYQQRVIADQAFATRLTETITKTCGTQ